MYAGVPSTLPACDSLPLPAGPLRTVAITVSWTELRHSLVGDASGGQHLGQAPVHHLDLAEGAHHHVRGLQIAVDHAAGMRIRHRLAYLLEDAEEAREFVVGWVQPTGYAKVFGARIGGLHPPYGFALRQQCRQGSALDQLHGEVWTPVGKCAQLVDRHDTRMLQLAADLRFLDKAVQDVGIAVVRLEHDLDGQVTAQIDVAALEDRAHPAPRDLALELEPAHARAMFPGHLGATAA